MFSLFRIYIISDFFENVNEIHMLKTAFGAVKRWIIWNILVVDILYIIPWKQTRQRLGGESRCLRKQTFQPFNKFGAKASAFDISQIYYTIEVSSPNIQGALGSLNCPNV